MTVREVDGLKCGIRDVYDLGFLDLCFLVYVCDLGYDDVENLFLGGALVEVIDFSRKLRF